MIVLFISFVFIVVVLWLFKSNNRDTCSCGGNELIRINKQILIQSHSNDMSIRNDIEVRCSDCNKLIGTKCNRKEVSSP